MTFLFSFFFFGALFWKPGRTNSFLFLFFFLSPLLVFGNDNMKLFLQLVPGIIFKQIFFPPLNCVTFAHLPLKKNPRSFYEGYPDIYISILSLLPPSPLPVNPFSNDGSGRFFWKKKMKCALVSLSTEDGVNS